MLHYKRVMTRPVTVEWRLITGILHTVPDGNGLFTRHRIELLTKTVGSYREEIMREIYASYVVILRGALD